MAAIAVGVTCKRFTVRSGIIENTPMLKSVIKNKRKVVSMRKNCLLEILGALDIYRRELS